MSIEEFARYSNVLHALTLDFARAVPSDKWDFTPTARARADRRATPRRVSGVFAPFNKQLRHVVCVRGVYNDALMNGKVDWTRKHEHYTGSLTRDDLLDALDDKQRQLLLALDSVDVDAVIDWEGTPFSFALFSWEYVQHEAIHHGQWSVYASMAGFDTPLSWRASWGL